MYAFGIANHSPEQVLEFLEKKAVIKKADAVAILPVGSKLKEGKTPPRKTIFIINIRDFLSNTKVLNSELYKDVKVFIFGSVLRLKELQNCVCLDAEMQDGVRVSLKKNINYSDLKKSITHQPKGEAFRKDAKYLFRLIDTAVKGSLLTPLMTFIYTFNASQQTPIKHLCAEYLYKNKKFTLLKEELKQLNISEKKIKRFSEILESEIANNYKKFFSEFKKDRKIKIDFLAKKMEVSPYEIRYLLSVIDEEKNYNVSKMPGTRLSSLAKASKKVSA